MVGQAYTMALIYADKIYISHYFNLYVWPMKCDNRIPTMNIGDTIWIMHARLSYSPTSAEISSVQAMSYIFCGINF